MATKHLLDLGHKDIAIILGPKNEQCTTERLDGYRMALAEVGLSPDNHLIVQGNWSAQSGSDAVEKLLTKPDRFSAIFAQNDRMAAGAIRSLREAGYHIPEDYSVIGYDDVPLASLIDPPLTTIHQPLEHFGEQASNILINSILENNPKPVEICIMPELIRRNSSTINKNNESG